MRTADLTGALLDYWVARAESVPADQLEIRPVQRPDPRTPDTICVHMASAEDWCKGPPVARYDPSTNWVQGGPLIEKHNITVRPPEKLVPWEAHAWRGMYWHEGFGDTALIAICRAVVHATFGDEVPHVCPSCTSEMRKSAAAGGWAPEGFTSELDHWYCDKCTNVIMFDEVPD